MLKIPNNKLLVKVDNEKVIYKYSLKILNLNYAKLIYL